MAANVKNPSPFPGFIHPMPVSGTVPTTRLAINPTEMQRIDVAFKTSDPVKKEIFDAIGDLSKLDRLFSARVLVATYIPPRKSKGGIIFTDSELQESIYQPAVGLVIAKGPRAFQDDASSEFHGQDVAIGDWVVHQGGARRVQINGVNCRIVDDTQIDMVVTSPDWLTHRQVDARVK